MLRRMRLWSICWPVETLCGPARMDGLSKLATPSEGRHSWHSGLLRHHHYSRAARPFGGRMELLVDGVKIETFLDYVSPVQLSLIIYPGNCRIPNETRTTGLWSTDGFPRVLFIYHEHLLHVRFNTMLLECPIGKSHNGPAVTCTRDQTPTSHLDISATTLRSDRNIAASSERGHDWSLGPAVLVGRPRRAHRSCLAAGYALEC